ncbi:MAG: hypothetical protein K0S33_4276 [Bacteroidetes bacterium]|jgi:hypothetical protein|nr:hypothetical protein [Bacteroidota bacterium]
MSAPIIEFTYSLDRKFRNDISIFQNDALVGKSRIGEYITLNARRFIYTYDSFYTPGYKIYFQPRKYALISNYREEEYDAFATILYKEEELKLNRSFFGSVLMDKGAVRLYRKDQLIGELIIEKKSWLGNKGTVKLYGSNNEEDTGVYLLALFTGKDIFRKKNDN